MALFQYSARNVIITITPVNKLYQPFNVLGYGEGAFLTVDLADDDFATTSGADGHVVRSFHPNPIANAVLTLQQTSPSNDQLTFLRNKDRIVVGSGVFGFSVKVPPITNPIASAIPNVQTGISTVISATGYVSKNANYEYGKDSGDRAWNLTLINPEFDANFIDQVFSTSINVANSIAQASSMVNSNN
jgi:hypothetical protein